MTKIMLVEDDNNLREIYEARLLAEGYEIVSAKDGEEALALAVKEKPDLIISDVMMPKISGFDMLDILRSTPETKDTKVIMMTALSQSEDKARADKLGADRYLVKSQVTLEDVAKVAREVLSGESGEVTPASPATAAPAAAPSAAPAANDTAAIASDDAAVAALTNSAAPAAAPAPPAGPLPETPAAAPATEKPAIEQTIVKSAPAGENAPVAVAGKKVIEPLNDLSQKGPNLDKLLAQEEAKDQAAEATKPHTSDDPDPNAAVPPHDPGKVIDPGGSDPGSVAL